MQDEDLQQLMRQARSATERLDWSAREFGFETRLHAHLASLQQRGPGTVALLWRAVAGCSVFVGLLTVWFILTQAPRAAEDDLTAFWDSGQTSYVSDLLN